MPSFVADVTVMLKPVVNDPQGLVVRSGLQQLGFATVESVRVGKQIVVTVSASDQSDAKRQVTDMCEKLLRNPVIEDYDVKISSPLAGANSNNER